MPILDEEKKYQGKYDNQIADAYNRYQQAVSEGYSSPYKQQIADAYNQYYTAMQKGYESPYQQQMADKYNAYANRSFAYDPKNDDVWRQYKNAYTQSGQKAMRDTVGEVSALTGGYGNSYAQTAGQQQYNEYLKELNGILPTLEQNAYGRYQQEGNDLMQQYSMLQGMDQTEYGRYTDGLNGMLTGMNALQGMDETEYNRYNNRLSAYLNDMTALQGMDEAEYNRYRNEQNYGLSREQLMLSQRESAYQQAMSMIQTGMMPSEEMLLQAGLTQEQAQALYDKLFPAGGEGAIGSGSGAASGYWAVRVGNGYKYIKAPTQQEAIAYARQQFGDSVQNYAAAVAPRKVITEQAMDASAARAPSMEDYLLSMYGVDAVSGATPKGTAALPDNSDYVRATNPVKELLSQKGSTDGTGDGSGIRAVYADQNAQDELAEILRKANSGEGKKNGK